MVFTEGHGTQVTLRAADERGKMLMHRFWAGGKIPKIDTSSLTSHIQKRSIKKFFPSSAATTSFQSKCNILLS